MDDDLRNGFAHKLNMDGKILWEQEYSAVDSPVELFFQSRPLSGWWILFWRHQLAT
ncbi:MAG: hypothetical protein IPK61_00015 [Saprospiraceae bacterium]|nr:hypothetical protein [Saprospiraceae bacterium]